MSTSVTAAPSITPLDCGWLRTQERVLVAGGSRDELRIPIPAWLIRHPKGVVLFDVGLHPDLADGPDALGPRAKYFTPDVERSGTIAPRLREHHVDPDGPLTVVVSHCHFDHVGGLCELPNARLIVHSDEWAAAMEQSDAGFDKALYDLGHDVLRVDGGHDVFGDRTIETIPTPGHTCGHQSLRVVTTDGPVILTADACYFTRTLDDGRLPPFGFDLERHAHSLELLRAERSRGVRIVPGHDADAIAAFAASATSVPT